MLGVPSAQPTAQRPGADPLRPSEPSRGVPGAAEGSSQLQHTGTTLWSRDRVCTMRFEARNSPDVSGGPAVSLCPREVAAGHNKDLRATQCFAAGDRNSRCVAALIIPSEALRDQPWEIPVSGRVGQHLSRSDPALPRFVPLAGAWAGSGPTPDHAGQTSEQKHIPEMLVLTVTDQHATKALRRGWMLLPKQDPLQPCLVMRWGYSWVTPGSCKWQGTSESLG